jgi:hypothetical protein
MHRETSITSSLSMEVEEHLPIMLAYAPVTMLFFSYDSL